MKNDIFSKLLQKSNGEVKSRVKYLCCQVQPDTIELEKQIMLYSYLSPIILLRYSHFTDFFIFNVMQLNLENNLTLFGSNVK